jgi:CheY-like chemotaxis protein
VVNSEPFAEVREAKTTRVLAYETIKEYAESIVYSVETLGVPCTLAESREELLSSLKNNIYQYAMVRLPLFEDLQNLIQDMEISVKPVMVLLADQDEAVSKPDIKTIIMPPYPLTIARLLNGEIDSSGGVQHKKVTIKFTAPEARLLLVDDVSTNLIVAEGLLAPYQANVDCCSSGEAAIKAVGSRPYDIIFMDHMMPGMDGLEATAAIRALSLPHAQDIPIIALTANAVSGMKEMFLSKGFNDYLSKPIEISKLDEIMEKWIPVEKKSKNETLPTDEESCQAQSVSDYSPLTNIGVDIEHGIAITGGTDEGYRMILTIFCTDVKERLALFETTPTGETISLFTIHVHALKSAAAAIGAKMLSEKAAELETAGRAENLELIEKLLGSFCQNLKDTVEQINRVLAVPNEAEDNK